MPLKNTVCFPVHMSGDHASIQIRHPVRSLLKPLPEIRITRHGSRPSDRNLDNPARSCMRARARERRPHQPTRTQAGRGQHGAQHDEAATAPPRRAVCRGARGTARGRAGWRTWAPARPPMREQRMETSERTAGPARPSPPAAAAVAPRDQRNAGLCFNGLRGGGRRCHCA
jgi:hypothetical protein